MEVQCISIVDSGFWASTQSLAMSWRNGPKIKTGLGQMGSADVLIWLNYTVLALLDCVRLPMKGLYLRIYKLWLLYLLEGQVHERLNMSVDSRIWLRLTETEAFSGLKWLQNSFRSGSRETSTAEWLLNTRIPAQLWQVPKSKIPSDTERRFFWSSSGGCNCPADILRGNPTGYPDWSRPEDHRPIEVRVNHGAKREMVTPDTTTSGMNQVERTRPITTYLLAAYRGCTQWGDRNRLSQWRQSDRRFSSCNVHPVSVHTQRSSYWHTRAGCMVSPVMLSF